MGQIENMQESDVAALKAELEELNKLPREVPITFKAFPQEDLDFAKRLTVLEEKVDKLLNRLTTIFGNYVLINGRFQDLRQMDCVKSKPPTGS